jgi:hypothetical protein
MLIFPERRLMPIALLIYKQRDPVPNKKNTPPSNFHHVKYIATRPRVMKNELSNHGLFGNAATGEISAIESLHQMQKLILQKSYERKNIHRGVISFTAETAKQLELKSKDDLLKMVKQNVHILAEKNCIKVENLRWVAAAHNERKHPHVHIMFWDDAQTMPQSYVSPKIPNEIRKQLIKNIFATELTAYYEEKRKATVSLQQISGEMVVEFEKGITSLSPKDYKELKELIDSEEGDAYHWNAEFACDSLGGLAKELFELKAKLPKTGRLSLQFLPSELKDEMIKLVDSLLASNEQLQSMLGLYVDSRLNLTEVYSDNMELYKKAAKDYTDEAKKLIANRILDAVKVIGKKEYELKNHEYGERMKLACIKELGLEVFNMLGKLTRINLRNSKGQFLFSTELSKQAKKEKAKELESAGGEWNGENDYEA